MIQGFLLAYLDITDLYLCRTEREFQHGFADFILEPFLSKYPDLPYGYVIELKYLGRQKWSDAKATALIAEGQDQLKQYLQDERLQSLASVSYKGLLLLFSGWELKAMREVG